MFGYQVVLASLKLRQHITLRVVSPTHYRTVVQLLRGEGLYRQYRDWTIVSFESAHASSPESRPVRLASRLAKPGSLIDTAA